MPSQKTKVAIGASVGAVVLAAAIGVTIYFVTKKSGGGNGPTPPPTPSGPTWTCVDDKQGTTMLLSNGTPCAKYTSPTVCQAAATAGTVVCNCPTSQVIQGDSCQPICLYTATWDSTQNQCVCPSGQKMNPNTYKCDPVCSPAIAVNQTTGAVSGFFNDNGVCTDSEKVTGKVPALDTICQQTACKVPTVCTNGMFFTGFDSSQHSCVAPNACNGKPYYYTWPDGANTCPGLTYSTSGINTTCVPPDNNALQVACEFTAGGCQGNTMPIQPGEQCLNGGGCRAFDATPTCPSGSVVNTTQCGSSGKGICYNAALNSCGPATYNCLPSALPCPSNTSSSPTCASSSVGPCLDHQNQCVPTLVGCRPDDENWTYNNGICTNQTNLPGLVLSVDPTSTINTVTVNATVPPSYSVPLLSLQFRYTMVASQGSPPLHWSGMVSLVQPSNSGNKQVQLIFYPDQSISVVPSGVTLKLFMMGLTQAIDGSWVPSISSTDLNDPKVTTCQLQPAPPGCLPSVGFSVNKALSLVPQLSNLPPALQSTIAVTLDASQLGLSNASTVPLGVGGNFAGAVSPVALPPYGAKSVSKMFIVLVWNSISNSSSPVTYVVTKANKPVYTGPLTMLVDTVDVNVQNSTTFSVQAQTSSSCMSQPQFTTCPPLEFSGAMCTSLKDSTSSVINFMIPDQSSSGCISIPTDNEDDAAYYACVYLQNPARSLEGVKVPSVDKTQCVSIVPVTNAQTVVPLVENTDNSGKPTGYCTNASCTTGASDLSRSAVCACGGSATLCNEIKDQTEGLPYVQLSNGESLNAHQFRTGMSGMTNFITRYPKLLF